MSPLSGRLRTESASAFGSRAPFCSMKARAVSTTPSLDRSSPQGDLRYGWVSPREREDVRDAAAPLVDGLVVVADVQMCAQFVQRPDDRLLPG
jgi:hypothetical protein